MSLEDNVKARELFKTIIEMIEEELKKTSVFVEHRFWKLLKKKAEEFIPNETCKDRYTPMSNDEAVRFENEIMQFGKHKGDKIVDIDIEYFEWLDSQPDFRRELWRYLKSEKIQKDIPNSVDEEETYPDLEIPF
jgi:uncharacterized protein (DUF3820 family)